MSRPEFRPDDSQTDPAQTIEQHILAGFPPDLALDLVLNELVVRVSEATHASAAALALVRDHEMVCRAATGHLAPDLGIPLNTRDGLSGACLQTRQPQLSVDTEFDPRIDPAVSRRLGIRSILIVPVFDINNSHVAGILEVFSTSPAAFSHKDQKLLEEFARECARICHSAIELSQRTPAAQVAPEFIPSALMPRLPDFVAASIPPASRAPYEAWTLILGSLAILATIAVSFLIGSRVGWLTPLRTRSISQVQQPIQADSRPPSKSCAGTAAHGCPAEQSSAPTTARAISSSKRLPANTSPASASNELVVYEKGKLIFRMRPATSQPDRASDNGAERNLIRQTDDSIVEASSTTKIATAPSVWVSPAQAETRILSRTEPQYPPEALAAHRAGTVILEVQVAEDGSVFTVHTLSGDPILAAAAAEAVRKWRYQPYRLLDHATQFQTDVTLNFNLPD